MDDKNSERMFISFLNNNKGIKHDFVNTDFNLLEKQSPEITAFFEECGGYNFNNGLYKTHTAYTSAKICKVLESLFLRYANRLIPFGIDWLGRQYAVDKSRKNFLLIFDPATIEDFEFHQSLVSFHNECLVNESEETLSVDFFKSVLQNLNTSGLDYTNCIGYKKPLILGGADEPNNYEILDTDIYWEIQSQIYFQIKNLPPGTKINTVRFEKHP